jgi:hypothetical protein
MDVSTAILSIIIIIIIQDRNYASIKLRGLAGAMHEAYLHVLVKVREILVVRFAINGC